MYWKTFEPYYIRKWENGIFFLKQFRMNWEALFLMNYAQTIIRGEWIR